MSKVYVKDRKETKIKYVVNAQQLQVEVCRYMMNDKRVPKSWRYMLAYGAIKIVSSIADNVMAACVTFPTTEEKLNLRKSYLNSALVNCYQLESRLLCIKRVIKTATIESMANIMSLWYDEIALLKSAIKNAKILNEKDKQEEV